MFVDHYERSLDSKNRLVLPKKFRDQLGTQVYLAPLDSSLAAYSEEAYAGVLERMNQQVRDETIEPIVRRAFTYTSALIDFDSAGRIGIPDRLIQYANLDREVLVSGAATHIEIWNLADIRAQEEAMNAAVLEAFKDGGTLN